MLLFKLMNNKLVSDFMSVLDQSLDEGPKFSVGLTVCFIFVLWSVCLSHLFGWMTSISLVQFDNLPISGMSVMFVLLLRISIGKFLLSTCNLKPVSD